MTYDGSDAKALLVSPSSRKLDAKSWKFEQLAAFRPECFRSAYNGCYHKKAMV
jgi:hypothetical protein